METTSLLRIQDDRLIQRERERERERDREIDRLRERERERIGNNFFAVNYVTFTHYVYSTERERVLCLERERER